MKILVTGVAGFIGFHVAKRLLERGDEVVGVDSLSDYYDVSLKLSRLEILNRLDGFSFTRGNLEDGPVIDSLFSEHQPQRVINLAAQAGVRYSLERPDVYVESNIKGFLNILEACRHHEVEHLVYASSSSVYGANRSLPFSVHQNVDHPVSMYAATKKANELMAHTYSHLFGVATTGLRFFTVYGPWGRPDMALFIFTKAILKGEPIEVFNHGEMQRDFTFIDDIVEGIVRVTDSPATPDPNWSGTDPDPASSSAPYRIFNIGNHTPVPLMRFIAVLEESLGQKADVRFLPMQPGDVPATYADVKDLMDAVGFAPATPIEVGIPRFVAWYRDYYKD